ncbi:MAG: SGNH/GDSL hydrolase family protein [Pseudomonadota bacterium]
MVKSSIANFFANLALSAAAILVTLATLELVVFRSILPPDDLIENVTINNVVRYKPGTNATFRHPDGRETQLTINAQGWNSTHADYATQKPVGRTRIAVVGDSYVHGAFVNVDDGFPHRLETKLNATGHDVEVFRFGMDGAPLSQYLNVLRREVVEYKPDIVVVPLIHNDFDESYRFIKTRYASAFMKLRKSEDGGIEEIPAADFTPGTADKLRRFATFRYLYYETGLYLHAKAWVNALFWGGNEEWDERFISSAVDIRKIKDHTANRDSARYVFAEMKKLSETHGFRLAFVMDGVREAIYQARSTSEFEVAKLNAIASDLTTSMDLPFVDLQNAFAADYEATRRHLEYPYDWHWNVRANTIVADEIIALITSQAGWLPPARQLTRPDDTPEAALATTRG